MRRRKCCAGEADPRPVDLGRRHTGEDPDEQRLFGAVGRRAAEEGRPHEFG